MTDPSKLIDLRRGDHAGDPLQNFIDIAMLDCASCEVRHLDTPLDHSRRCVDVHDVDHDATPNGFFRPYGGFADSPFETTMGS